MRSPVLLIIFNRPETTRRVVEAIRSARPPRLYVAADGPRPEREGEASLCQMAREIATAVDWPCEVKTLFRKRNLGCRMAVSSAVTWFFRQEPEGIVLEDDVLPHPDFFPFCDTLLAHYRDTPRVMQISGNNFQLGKRWGDASYYFSIFNHIWGWASWARAWNLCDLDMPGFRSFMRHTFPRRFPLPEASAYFMTQFERIARGTLDTWDYSWQYCHFLHDGLTVIPNVPLAKNIGFGSGAHCLDPSVWAGLEPASMPLPLVQPDRIGADMDADKTAFRTVWKAGGTSLESLLALGMERARTGHAYANETLIEVARRFYGDSKELDALEAMTRLAGEEEAFVRTSKTENRQCAIQ